MKKIISLFLALVMVCVLPVNVLAANVSLDIDKSYVDAGDTVVVTITLDEAIPLEEEVTAIQLELNYSRDVLTFVSGEQGAGYENLTITNSTRSDKVKISWVSMTGTPVGFPAGTVAVITFTAVEATDAAKLELSVDYLTANKYGAIVDENVGTATITVCPNHNVVETVVEGNCTTPTTVTRSCETCGYNEVIEGDLVHNIAHVEANGCTCWEDGNIEYWYCTECGCAWLDEDCTLNTDLLSVVLPVTGHDIVHVEAVEPTCLDDGNIEYWYCTCCGYAWLDEDCTLNTNLKAVILPHLDHDIVHVEAVEPTCLDDGNIEYWYCTCCGYAWLDEDCTLNTNLKAVILPHLDHEVVHVEAKAPTTEEEGNIEYWYCERCGFAWLDAECTLNTNLLAVILPRITETDDTVIYGDVNADEAVDMFDALMVIQFYNEEIELTEDQVTAADVNGDDAVDIFDAMLIIQFYNEELDIFPVEG